MRARHLIMATLLMLTAPVTVSAAETDNGGTFSFVVLGHVIGLDNGRMNPLFDELLTEVRELDPDMIFLAGDLICDFTDDELAVEPPMAYQWDRLDAELKQLGVPIYHIARYGEPPQAVSYGRSLFLLLNSSAVPEGDAPASYQDSRGKPLDSRQINFIREKLLEDEPYDHVFLFIHHLLWWSEGAPWWRDVHPLLVGRNVRAVFGGDLGPMKFSHMQRDGVDYVQSGIEQVYAIENPRAVEWLHNSEGARLLARQFDNFLYVTVDGPQITIEVKTVGETSSGKFSPQRFRDVHGDVWHRVVEKSWVERVWNVIGTPWRLVALALVLGICFLGGVTTGVVWKRRKAG